MGYLERSCENLEHYITKIVSQGDEDACNMESSHLMTLRNQVFRDARSEVEQFIDEALRGKVSEFLDIGKFLLITTIFS